MAATWNWPANPALRHRLKTALREMIPGLVSIVLPCFDAERFLPEALDSLLGQTYGISRSSPSMTAPATRRRASCKVRG